MKRAVIILLVFAVVLGTSGCGQQTQPISNDDHVATALAGTAAIETLIAEKAAATVAAIPTETFIPTPTLTSTPTPLPPVTAQLTINAYCRPGPDAIYGQGKMLHSGDSVLVVGKVDDSAAWLFVTPPDGSENCWVATEVLAITGETTRVEIVLAPPTPTPIPDWNGKWTIWFVYSAGVECTQVVAFTQNGNNLSAAGTCTTQNLTHNYSLQGTVSANRMTVQGTYTNPWVTISFYMERDPDNLEQFRGRVEDGSSAMPFCGTRISGGSKPNPCLP